eukprot:2293324-Rhodomonas_salina.2
MCVAAPGQSIPLRDMHPCPGSSVESRREGKGAPAGSGGATVTATVSKLLQTVQLADVGRGLAEKLRRRAASLTPAPARAAEPSETCSAQGVPEQLPDLTPASKQTLQRLAAFDCLWTFSHSPAAHVPSLRTDLSPMGNLTLGSTCKAGLMKEWSG